ncbi:O-succinylbenzoic acid--CoA ligase [Algoriphagus locisalis]|uniref:O-succinylbenzoic acid--CoA ligase n=1 Tax=Algoriphagus locisalis TaxID=305507 RepID=A0A1I7BH83_9BACT|nr:AMP-binding protein [Algoriphagus locisalis]SFT86523.1 O-succinylbenzoic acid--CoA ligase [Algoriphagus locisalis]
MFQLTFDNHIFQTKKDFEIDTADFPDFAKAAIQFCKDWISGQKIFEQQTSGSIGTPKRIEISRDQMIASAKATQGFFETDENTTLLCCLDPNYIAGKMMLVRAMVWNAKTELIEPKSNPLLELNEIPDFVAMVPLQVDSCIQDKTSREKLKKIKHLIIGGAPISSGLREKLITNEIQAFQTYGMTETVSHIALAKIEAGELIYRTLPGVEIGTDDRNAIWVKSAASNNELVQTNDAVDTIDQHSFHWLGRVDFVINSGGVKLHPELLEAKAEAIIHRFYPNSAFFFFGMKDDKLGEKLCMAIESTNDTKENLLQLKKALVLDVDRYEVPKNTFIIPAFSRTKSGKINRPKTIERI